MWTGVHLNLLSQPLQNTPAALPQLNHSLGGSESLERPSLQESASSRAGGGLTFDQIPISLARTNNNFTAPRSLKLRCNLRSCSMN